MILTDSYSHLRSSAGQKIYGQKVVPLPWDSSATFVFDTGYDRGGSFGQKRFLNDRTLSLKLGRLSFFLVLRLFQGIIQIMILFIG